MNVNLELLSWWSDADWIVRGVFIILVLLSLISWTIMLYKAWQLHGAYRGEIAFRGNGRPVSKLPSAFVLGGLTNISTGDRSTLAGVLMRESRLGMEGGLTALATIGNTAPFIGLFGTVWGIMHALQGLGAAEALSMDLVAGPVAEALVATAAGLFTAIPAVVGYNLLLRQLRRLFGAVDSNVALVLARQGAEG
ncbi:MAG: MotA/TolQ/ExbB proton channel family protein [Alphaproteobacteria bacterium]|nr:MotA/TolQ/ExbB proton channel family protein [Alphaproteobacteria bacterium]